MDIKQYLNNPNSAKAFLNKKKSENTPKPIRKEERVFTEKQLDTIVSSLVKQEVAKIPKAKDGSTPTREEIKAIITPLIPVIRQPKDGKDGEVSPKHLDQIVTKVLGQVAVTPDLTNAIVEVFKNEKVSAEMLPGFSELRKRVEKLADNQKWMKQPMGGGYTDNDVKRVIDSYGGGGGSVDDTAYGASWDGDTTTAASRNAIYDKIETLAGGHDPVTVTDSAEIDFTLTGQDITASLKAASIDETKLDASVNASLDKADSALQSFTETDPVVGAINGLVKANGAGTISAAISGTDYAAALGADDNYVTDAEKVVIGNTSGTNTGDQDLSTYQVKPSEGAFVDGDKTKLDGIATSATANDTDTNLKARANHTGTQTASTISDFASVALSSAPAETATTIGVINAAATSKTTPVNADSYPIVDSEASNVIKRLTFTNLKAFLKTYFDTLYAAVSGFTMTGDLLLGENSLELDGALSATDKWSGVTVSGTAGTTVNFGDALYLAVADSRWELVDASAEGTSGSVPVLLALGASTDGSAVELLVQGTVRDTAWSWTVGGQIYLSETGTTGNTLTQTAPTTTDSVTKVVGYAVSATEMVWNPSVDYLTHV